MWSWKRLGCEEIAWPKLSSSIQSYLIAEFVQKEYYFKENELIVAMIEAEVVVDYV